MSYVQVDSSVRTNRKFLQAGPAASWLWLCGNAYCQETLTDGFIPFEAIRYIGVRSPKSLIRKLVAARLWDECEGGWRVHDYLEHNKSAEDIKNLKRRRSDGGHLGGRPPKEPSSETLKVSDKVNLPRNPSTASATATTSATTSATATFARAGGPLHDRSHREHAHCGRVCVHSRLHDEFVRRRNHQGADDELRKWYMVIETQWAHSPDEPGDAFEFWRKQYGLKWPAQSKKPFGTWRPSEAS